MYNEQEGTRPTVKRETFLSMRTFSEGNSLSVSDATRELTKCANGQLVSHDIVRDGIDGLLQLKRASYDITPTEEHTNMSPWGADGLRTRPEPPFTVPSHDHRDHRQQNDAEDSGDDDDCSTCRSNSPDPDHRRISENIKPVSKSTHGHVKVGKAKPLRRPPPPKKPAKSTKPTRPPTIWHSRKSDPPQPTLLVPDSPKSKTSHESTYNSDDNESDEADETTPAVLHFSCIQCHRAKKRCNRTRPCTRCISRGLENECRYPDKHDPRSVLRACLRCWQTKKKCDRKQPSCGKCDKVGVKCVYRREQNDQEGSPVQSFQVPTPTLTMSPPPISRLPSDSSTRTTPPSESISKKRKMADTTTTEFELPRLKRQSSTIDGNHIYPTRTRRDSRNNLPSTPETLPSSTKAESISPPSEKRTLRTRK